MPRRKPGALLPLEVEILRAALSMQRDGDGRFHGFGLAQRLGDDDGGARLIGHGTLYKALGRLEAMGLLRSEWEQDPPRGRPRRRQYELTVSGVRTALATRDDAREPAVGRRFAPGTA
ncbi:MAG: PadR family transcriptional regulator [Acidimicrobiia bacterium]